MFAIPGFIGVNRGALDAPPGVVLIGTPTLPTTPWGIPFGTTPATSASFTPTANSTIIVFSFCTSGSSLRGATVSDSIGGTWTQIGGNFDGPGASQFCRARMHYHLPGATPAARTVTLTGDLTSLAMSGIAVEITGGVSTDFTNNNGAGHATGDPSFTVTTPDAGSAVLAFYGNAANTAVIATPPSGYTTLQALAEFGTSGDSVSSHYDLSSPGTTLAWVASGANCVGCAVELKQV